MKTIILSAVALAALVSSADAGQSKFCTLTFSRQTMETTMSDDASFKKVIERRCPGTPVEDVVCIRDKKNFLCTNDVKTEPAK